jgi:biopolymer transport protein TolR
MDGGEDMSEINLVPYLDIITNILLFLLVTVTSIVAVGNIEVDAPQYAVSSADKKENKKKETPFNTTVIITNKGFTVSGTTGIVYENDEAGRLPTVPKADDQQYNFLGLQKVLKKIKEKYPKEQQAILSANPDIPYEIVVQTMDVVRSGQKNEPLFPSIVFSAGIEQ